MFGRPLLMVLLLSPFFHGAYAQIITNADGSPFTAQYCWADTDYGIAGQPGGGVFSGCGVFQQNGNWYFNPVTATQGVSVFPYQCTLTYTVNGSSVNVPVLIWKPVIITPPLQDSFTCTGDFYLHATTLYAGAYKYAWTPAVYLDAPDSPATSGHIAITQTFVLTATDVTSGCTGSDTVEIHRYQMPQITVTSDTVLLPHQSIKLSASGADSYQWSPVFWLDNPQSPHPVATPEAPVTYTVTGTNEYGCTATAQVHIGLHEQLFFPNAFSPNGDGRNDVFRMVNYGFQELLEFRIFNRWGQEVFHTRDGLEGWDGTYGGKPADAGTYGYYVRLRLRDGTEQVYKGDVLLVR